jgi:hypothetical protein
MATPQLSPGIISREVDLTVGRADNIINNVGAIAGPFPTGPVDEVTDITTEQELINVFGTPQTTDGQYEYWMSASSYLSYGGALKVVRTGDADLRNSAATGIGTTTNNIIGIGSTNTIINNYQDYNDKFTDDASANWSFAAKYPGSYFDGVKVAIIDNYADQTIGIGTTIAGNNGAIVGAAVTTAITTIALPGITTTSFTGYVKGIVVGVTTSIDTTTTSVDIKIISRVSSTGTETLIDYAESTRGNSFATNDNVRFGAVATAITATTAVDWYNQQTIGSSYSTTYWKSIAPKPVSTNYALERNGDNDAIHIAVIDDSGSITGVRGNLLEKHLFLSKAIDAVSNVSSPQKIWWRNYLALYSSYIYGGKIQPTTPGGFQVVSGSTSTNTQTNQLWNQDALNVTFNSIGNQTVTLGSGVDYTANGGLAATLGSLYTSYQLFANKDNVSVDYLIMGPGLSNEVDSQAKAIQLISIANERKDCIAFVSPHRANVIGLTDTTTQTNNIVRFFNGISSSSYAVFDSGYKYTYDRYNNIFRYIPCNADIAGLMVRTAINSYPWFSPAGQERGVLNNAIKLAYSPNKAQRDTLYSARVNSVINQNGIGIILFGDKTALSYASAFDRINVRALFLVVEQALERTGQAQLFQLNDSLTRSNFVNIVEPYLRDVQAKRGLYDFRVVCDESNNTPDIIDNNEFRADIYLKPTKSINYVTLTFVATRTGISFEEVTGRA